MAPKFGKTEIHSKKWGREIWIDNNPLYCGKILEFKKDSSFSMHYHMQKIETWAVVQGSFEMIFFDLSNAEEKSMVLNTGDTVKLPSGVPHKLICRSDVGLIFEVSTEHFDHDSYRIGKGDSQS